MADPSSKDENNEKQRLLEDSQSASLTLEKNHSCSDSDHAFTTREIIDHLGFGKAQILTCSILSLSYIGGFSAIQLQPFLSARLYVEMQLSPYVEALLGSLSLAGLFFSSLPFGIISDRFGRKKATLLTCFLTTFWNLMSCVAPNITWIVICRLMVSVSRG